MSKLPISIVVPCSDDTRLKKCLASIDVACDVVVALNAPSREVRKIVKDCKVGSVLLTEKSLPRALNMGISASKYNKVILIDSDCTFNPGAIESIFGDMQKHMVVKGHVDFKQNSLVSSVVAKYRSYINYFPPKPYNPFLCLNKGVSSLIGGYIFDETIYWTEDAELYTRLKKAHVDFFYAASAVAVHDTLTIRQDVSSAFRYGTGKARRVLKKISSGPNTHFKDFLRVLRISGLAVALYSILWNLSYAAGYFWILLKSKNGRAYEKGI
jgi:cellulose synthase/poly-beta-1,6-N-acetylglucosamine synthase-like glycosyltransferase